MSPAVSRLLGVVAAVSQAAQLLPGESPLVHGVIGLVGVACAALLDPSHLTPGAPA